MSKNIGLPLLSISKMPTNTFPVVFGVQQNPCKCQCRAYFIKKVKLRKHLLKMFHKKVEKYQSLKNIFHGVHIFRMLQALKMSLFIGIS